MNAQLAPDGPASITGYAPGIHAAIPSEIYHRREIGVVNKGALDQIAKTPAHYLAWVNGAEQAETPALVFGRALHALVLEPDLFAQEWALRPDFGDLRTKAGKAARDAWQAGNEGVSVVSVEDWDKLHAMRDAVMTHPIAGQFFVGGVAESTAVWTDPRTGLLCKSRMDYRRADLCMIGDLKSTEDASPRGFARSVTNYRYHVQDAHYSDGERILTGKHPDFLFVAVEKTAPFSVGVYMLDDEARDRGYALRERAMDTLSECLQSDTWPGFPPVVNTLSLPAWAFAD